MSSSSEDSDNPFGKVSDEEQDEPDQSEMSPPPDYINSKEFEEFQNCNLINVG